MKVKPGRKPDEVGGGPPPPTDDEAYERKPKRSREASKPAALDTTASPGIDAADKKRT